MGVTKRAVTIYGLQVPMNKIVDEHVNIINRCVCMPKSDLPFNDASARFCPKCGENVAYKRRTTSVKKGLDIKIDGDCNLISIAGYRTSGSVGEGNCVYVGIVVSETDAAYSAEGSDPVMYDMPLITDMDIRKFRQEMQKYDLWNSLKFGLWTVLLLG